MISVTRKDSKEPLESMVRRFSRKVQQSGILMGLKQAQHFQKPISKRDRRAKAIIRRDRKNQKIKRIKMAAR